MAIFRGALQMHSYRCIQKLDIHFRATGPIVLIGENGSGKSSILECIAKMLSLFTNLMNDSDKSELSVFSESDIALSSKSSELKNIISIRHDIEDAVFSGEETDLIEFYAGFSESDFGLRVDNNIDELSRLALRLKGRLIRNNSLSIPVIAFYPASRTSINSFDLAKKSSFRSRYQ